MVRIYIRCLKLNSLILTKEDLLSSTFVRQTSGSDYPLMEKILLSRQENQVCHHLTNTYGSNRKMQHHKMRSSQTGSCCTGRNLEMGQAPYLQSFGF